MDASSTDARSPEEFSGAARWLPWAVVALAAILPYLSTLGDYFVRDDFGVVQLLAQKPWWYFPRWFLTPWMDDIWGYTPDEIRPFPAITYQLTALGGIVSPVLHHVLNIVMHAINAWLVMAIARRAAGLSVAAAAFAGIVFALLPVHTESVAWITGRVDSMPALFYLATFLAYVNFRQRPRASTYVWSLVLFFIALFTKQNTITMVATLVGYDVIVARRPLRPIVGFALPYVPFALMTAGYLWLRFVLFHQVAREGALNARALEDFRILLDRHLRHVVGGSLDAHAVVVWLALGLVVLAWLVLRRGPDGRNAHIGRNLFYFGPVWWAIGVLPIAVAGYHSPRHVYLAAVGWAVVLGAVCDAARRYRPSATWQRGIRVAAAAVAVFYLVPLLFSVREWNRTAAVSHQVVRDVRTAVLGAPEGALIVIGAPGRSWEWALPFAVRPPYQRTDLRFRAFIISPRALSCCTAPWFEETRQTIRNWSAGPAPNSAIALRWDRETGKLTRIDERSVPQLPVLMRALLDMGRPEEADDNLRRMLDVLAGPQ